METSRLLNYDTKKSEYTVVIPQDTSFKNYLEKENYLSDFITLEERNRVLENLGLDTNLQERLSTVEGDIESLSSDIYKINTNISNIDISIEEIQRLLGLEEGEGEEGEEDENSLTTIINNAISKYLSKYNIGSRIAIDDDHKSFTSNNVTYTLSLNKDNKLGFSTYTPVTATLTSNPTSETKSYFDTRETKDVTFTLILSNGTSPYYIKVGNDGNEEVLDSNVKTWHYENVNCEEGKSLNNVYYRDSVSTYNNDNKKSIEFKYSYTKYPVYYWTTSKGARVNSIDDSNKVGGEDMARPKVLNISYTWDDEALTKVQYFAIPFDWTITEIADKNNLLYTVDLIDKDNVHTVDYNIYRVGHENGVGPTTWKITIAS